jgi:CHAT domain-containing protein
MPTTTGTDQPLPHAEREAHLVKEFLPDATVLVDTPTREDVLNQLADSALAHFACHSVADSRLPGHGKLLLHDHLDNPLTVTDLMTTRLDKARLAYLSACDTATVAATDLLDEATHLTTAFLLDD